MINFLGRIFKSKPYNIYDLISNDDVVGLRKLLEKGQYVNELDEYGQTPIFRVVYNKSQNQEALLRLLIKFGASLNSRNKDGATALFNAKGNIAKILIDSGADVNIKSFNNSTPLHYSFDIETATIFIEQGLDINAPDNNFITPLHNYVYFGSLLVNFAVQKGANVNAIDINGWSPLIYLSRSENVNEKDIPDLLKTAEMLIQSGAKVEITDKFGKTAYNYALEADNMKLADWLIQKK